MGPKERAQKVSAFFKKTGSFEYVSGVRSASDGFKFSTDVRPYYYVELEFQPAGGSWTEHYEIRFLKYPATGSWSDQIRVKGPHAGMVSEMEEVAREM